MAAGFVEPVWIKISRNSTKQRGLVISKTRHTNWFFKFGPQAHHQFQQGCLEYFCIFLSCSPGPFRRFLDKIAKVLRSGGFGRPSRLTKRFVGQTKSTHHIEGDSLPMGYLGFSGRFGIHMCFEQGDFCYRTCSRKSSKKKGKTRRRPAVDPSDLPGSLGFLVFEPPACLSWGVFLSWTLDSRVLQCVRKPLLIEKSRNKIYICWRHMFCILKTCVQTFVWHLSNIGSSFVHHLLNICLKYVHHHKAFEGHIT